MGHSELILCLWSILLYIQQTTCSIGITTVPVKKKIHFFRFSMKKANGKFSISLRNSMKKTEQREVLWRNFSQFFRQFKLTCACMLMPYSRLFSEKWLKIIICFYSHFHSYVIRLNKKMNCFSGTATSLLKSRIIFFYCFLRIKMNKNCISSFITSLSLTTMRFYSDVAVHCW